MKAYFFDTISRFKRYSAKLDVATTLCNKTWVVFNDSGERELYLFLDNCEVLITTNGVGVKAKWEWIPANNSLVIDNNNSIIMLNLQYIDGIVLALTLDGTTNCAFLIEEKNQACFAPKTLSELETYFLSRERIENQKIEDSKNRESKAVEQKKRELFELQKEQAAWDKAENIKKTLVRKSHNSCLHEILYLMSFGAIGGSVVWLIICASSNDYSAMYPYIWIVSITLALTLLVHFLIPVYEPDWNKIEEWKRNNPHDPACKFLKEHLYASRPQ